MFGGGTSTEYEDIVNKTTDENLTSENWELILNLCDKVQEEGQPGAHAAIAAVLKRLAHRNPNVQLYALSLTESLGKNLGIEIHREIASRAFTQGLEKLIMDRNSHEKVRRRALVLIAQWTAEFEKDESLGIMEECYNNLKAKNYKFDAPQEAPPPTVDDEIRRKEEEELQRVLEMSMQDRGGRSQWSDYSLASGSSSTAAGSSSSGAGRSSTAAASASTVKPSGSSSAYTAPKYSGGYVPARTPSPATVAAKQRQQQEEYQKSLKAAQQSQISLPQAQPQQQPYQPPAATPAPAAPAPAPVAASSVTPTPASTSASANMNIVTRVRALHAFEPTEPGELAFDKGDVIKVVDRGYKDWWRGQLKGRTGIFPVNYVEAMPEPTATELAKEAEQEAAVFSQAVNVEKLLNMLRAMDPSKDNLADNEEIQELYRSSMALRPKIVKLIDKYSQKRADLVSMNETFVRARTIFDRMMEESLARHTGVYEQPTFRPQFSQIHPQARPGSRNTGRSEYVPTPGPGPAGPQPYGWGPQQQQQQPPPQAGYNIYPNAGPAPGGYPGGPTPTPGPEGVGSPYPTATPRPGQQGYGGGLPQGPQQPQQQPQQVVPGGYGVVPQGGYAGHQPNAPYSQQGPTPYPVQSQQPPAQQPQSIQQQPMQPQSIQQQPMQPQQPFQQQQPQQPPQPQQPQPAFQQPQQPAQSPQQQQQPPFQQQPAQQPQQMPAQQPQQQPSFQSQPAQQPQQQPSFQSQPAQQPQQQPAFQQQPQQQPALQQQPAQQPQQQPPYQQQQPQLQRPQSYHQAFQQPIQPLAQPAQEASHEPQTQPQLSFQSPVQQPQPTQQQLPVQSVQPLQQAQPQPVHAEAAQVSPQAQVQPTSAGSPQPQPQAQQHDVVTRPQPQVQPEPHPIAQEQSQPQPQQPISGPLPYPYHPSYKYADPNAQAWADYYTQGGKDLTGAVYFISIPGVKEEAGAPSPQEQQQPAQQQPEQQGVSRQQSYVTQTQAQPQQQLQTEAVEAAYTGHVQPQPQAQAENPSPYGSADAVAVQAPSPVSQHLQNMPRYQLSDGPAQQSQLQPQPQYATQYGVPSAELSPKISSPTTATFGTAPLNVHHKPGAGGRAHSPQGAATPSWVLPKKSTPSGSPNGGSPPIGGSYFPLSNQLAG